MSSCPYLLCCSVQSLLFVRTITILNIYCIHVSAIPCMELQITLYFRIKYRVLTLNFENNRKVYVHHIPTYFVKCGKLIHNGESDVDWLFQYCGRIVGSNRIYILPCRENSNYRLDRPLLAWHSHVNLI